VIAANPANENLTYDNNGLHLTEAFEGVRYLAYRDQNGVLTIGYGHTAGVYAGMQINQAQAEAFLLADVKWAERVVKTVVKVPLAQGEFDGCVDLCFNIGSGNFEKSTVVRDLNAGDKHAAMISFMLWDKVAGQENKGLARRRLTEEELFGTGILKVAA
jgi:lysozyme